MSAYGSIVGARRPPDLVLHPRVYALAHEELCLAVFPLRREDVPLELATYLLTVFNNVVQEGRTYPQEFELDMEAFAAYYLNSDLFLGILMRADPTGASRGPRDASHLDIATLKGSQTWEACVGGMYYIKPNYPGRSSHICNAGFVVAPAHRGLKVGSALGRSYLFYAPRLGYRASIFNLVYSSNEASLRIWDRLGFQRIGIVPEAGRLKTMDGREDTYVDALVYWRRLIADDEIEKAEHIH